MILYPNASEMFGMDALQQAAFLQILEYLNGLLPSATTFPDIPQYMLLPFDKYQAEDIVQSLRYSWENETQPSGDLIYRGWNDGPSVALAKNIHQFMQSTGTGGGPTDLFATELNNAVQFMSTNGQSLGQSHSGGADETFVQEFQAKAFPADKTTTTFADLVPAVVTNYQILGGASYVKNSGEGPLYGMLGAGYQFGNMLTDMSAHHRINSNSAKGSTPISLHQKGQATYTSTIAAATAAKNYALSIGKVPFDMGFGWFQGEGDGTETKATYLTALRQLAYDYSVDRLAISEQDPSMPPAMFTYTTQSRGIATGTRDGVARAQHQAALDYFNGVTPPGKPGPVPVFLSAPNYFMGYRYDPTGVHVPAHWSYMMGAYVALAQYHCYMKASALPFNKRFPPIHPIAVAINGAEMIVTYQMRVPGTELKWGVADYPNGEGIPLQQDYGFAAHDGTSLVAMLTPVIIAPNQIKFTLASGVWGNGYRLGYALDREAVHHTFYFGGAGNLRDNYGDTVRCNKMNLPMHNWAACIDINIGAAGAWSLS